MSMSGVAASTGNLVQDIINKSHALGVWPHPGLLRAAGAPPGMIAYPRVPELPSFDLTLHVERKFAKRCAAGKFGLGRTSLDLIGWTWDSGTVQVLVHILATHPSISKIRYAQGRFLKKFVHFLVHCDRHGLRCICLCVRVCASMCLCVCLYVSVCVCVSDSAFCRLCVSVIR
jgi:hypothetical protein